MAGKLTLVFIREQQKSKKEHKKKKENSIWIIMELLKSSELGFTFMPAHTAQNEEGNLKCLVSMGW